VDMTRQVLETLAKKNGDWQGTGVGVDVELVHALSLESHFLDRNFTAAEQAYCWNAADPRASFAGRWSAKEAAIKAVSSLALDADSELKVWTEGAGAPLKDVEILPSGNGAPVVVFHGEANKVARECGVHQVKVTISHAGNYSVAVAYAQPEVKMQ